MNQVKLIECPRDAMQGIHAFIPTQEKVNYLNQLLQVGFDTLDFGSFVSPKAIPQLADTAEVLAQLQLTSTKLLAIVANLRGAETAMAYSQIQYIGFPFSVSETFQQRNTNSSMSESLVQVQLMQELCVKHNKTLVVYLSMGFGNPYGDVWNVEVVEHWVRKMDALGITILSLSDTIGVADPSSITYLFSNLIPAYPHIEFGAHLHTLPWNWEEKINAAWHSGCRRYDGAIRGFGGCPMAADKLTGNMPTEHLLEYLERHQIAHQLHADQFGHCMLEADQLFGKYV